MTALTVKTPMPPPEWALLERALLAAQARACKEYFDRYFDERGYLLCVPRWGGDDGPDDAIESLTDWPVLHALGAGNDILRLYKKGWEGHLSQYTEARTVEVPFARDGMYYKEFPVMFDWVHNGEGLVVFHLQGLSDPYDRLFEMRVRRFAGFYMNEDPQAPNYDPERKIIRSLFNGSRGPLLRKATALDWTGDPIEVEGRFNPRHGERNYQEMLAHFEEYTDIVGDHPQNLVATGLALNAYTLTGETRYRDWLTEYVDAWAERTRQNGGIIPSNIGLDGTVGGECGGRWYGGTYGWGFSVTVPQTGEKANRNTIYLGLSGFGNALLATGDRRYVDVWRNMINAVNANAKTVNGQTLYPHMFGDEGWYDYTPQPFSHGALEVYYWSLGPEDLKRLPLNGWVGYLQGQNPDYPAQALRRDFEAVRQRVDAMRQDATTPDTRLSDDPMVYNPAAVRALVELMLGGLHPRHAQPLHCQARYFDPENRRAGVPEDVAALVEKITPEGIELTLVNLDPVEARTVAVQGGAYGEHQWTGIEAEGQRLSAGEPFFNVRLAPGAGSRLTLSMNRYANPPTFIFPWDR
ncbi:MAG: hypothetical protein IT210_15050 [Armatimonadetes bacterium]|nr:hypothetical protein [Armatimonadota bacterium]